MTAFLHACIAIGLILLAIAVILVMVRLILGPSLPDRVAALDVIATLVICIIGLFAITSHHSIYLDIVIALALISFLGTVAFAQYIEFQLNKREEEDHG